MSQSEPQHGFESPQPTKIEDQPIVHHKPLDELNKV